MADKGWIKLHRSLQDCWVWNIEKPFDERSAWIDLLLSANHTDVKIPFNGHLILVKRGQFVTSVRKLEDKWKWNKDKVLKFLRLLESDKMIKRESDRFRTLISIENYDIYQDKTDTERTQVGTGVGTRQVQEHATNKNEKNDKNINNNNMSIFAINALFEELWLLYPRKKGKGQISDAKKRKIADVGKDQMIRAIERYKRYVSTQKDLSYQYGSTFFNSGYIDYLDENYVEKDEAPKNTKGTGFNNFEGRNYDMSSLEQQLLGRG